jgi:hypothetical protein
MMKNNDFLFNFLQHSSIVLTEIVKKELKNVIFAENFVQNVANDGND